MSLRVVIADDVPGLRAVYAAWLSEDLEFKVVGEAADGREALAVVAETQPDLLLLDLAMPEMDGLEVLERIATVSPGTRVVVISAIGAHEMADRVRRRGAIAYIQKGGALDGLARELRSAWYAAA